MKHHARGGLFGPVWVGALLALVVLTAACGRNARVTPPAPLTPPATGLPPAPTAPPLTALPTALPTPRPGTAVVPSSGGPTAAADGPTTVEAPATIGIPTTTPLAPQGTPNPNTGVDLSGDSGGASAPQGGVYVTRLRVDPPVARNKDAVTFFATFANTTGRAVDAAWCVEVFRPGERKAFGSTRCNGKRIPAGVSEQSSTGWEISGVRQCIPIVARVVKNEGVITPYVQANGAALWLNFSACP